MNGDERKKDENECGAVWRRTSKAGKEYMQGEITLDGKMTRLVFFPVKSQHPKAPHYRILISKPREQDRQAEQRADDGFDMGDEER